MHSLEHRVAAFIRDEELLEPGGRVLVAVSGGPDSVGLLRLLIALRDWRLEIRAGHVNHAVRGVQADRDEEFVHRLCAGLEVPLETHRLQPPGARSGNLEARLRHERYRFLLKEARRHDSVLATGHTLDDQAETLLLHAARGAGLRGLGGIRPRSRRSGVRVVRPLGGCTRRQVLAYLDEIGQTFCRDASNLDLERDRNWVRHELIPLIEQRLNPRLNEALGRTAALVREVEQDLRRRARKAYRAALGHDAGPGILLDVPTLRRLSPVLRRQVLLEALEAVRGDRRRLELVHVQDVMELLERPSGRPRSLPGCRVRREYDRLRLWTEPEVPEFCYELSVPGRIFVKEVGRSVSVRRTTARRANRSVRLEARADRFQVRNRRPGDRILLEGRRRPLKQLFERRRVALGERDRLLVIEQRGEVAFVERLGVADGFRARPNAGQIVELSIDE